MTEFANTQLYEYHSRLVGQLPYTPRPYAPWWKWDRDTPGFRYARFVWAELDRVNMLLGRPGCMKGAEWWMSTGDDLPAATQRPAHSPELHGGRL